MNDFESRQRRYEPAPAWPPQGGWGSLQAQTAAQVSLVQAGVLTVGIFGGLTAYAFASRRDFSFLRGMVVTGLVVVILAGLLNIFIGSTALGFALAAATLLLFAGFVLYD